jgi:hypothetical protein
LLGSAVAFRRNYDERKKRPRLVPRKSGLRTRSSAWKETAS